MRRLARRITVIVVGDIDMDAVAAELARVAEEEAAVEIEDLLLEARRERSNTAWIAALRLRGLG